MWIVEQMCSIACVATILVGLCESPPRRRPTRCTFTALPIYLNHAGLYHDHTLINVLPCACLMSGLRFNFKSVDWILTFQLWHFFALLLAGCDPRKRVGCSMCYSTLLLLLLLLIAGLAILVYFSKTACSCTAFSSSG